ncbi:MAG: transposase [Deltaproteobacteria bacterium]|nr:MAG: transposase [Deltaproteobacteria bacterium]
MHHVIVRVIERRKSFQDNPDKNDFLEHPCPIPEETFTACYARALLPNHIHLLLKTGTAPLIEETLVDLAMAINS